VKVITQRDLIKNILITWKTQYPNPDPNKKEIEINLSKLNLKTVAVSTVNKIIGNSSWTSLRCDECLAYVGEIIQVGEEPDYESATACLCSVCLRKAYQLLNGTE
jgi:hypothetical protein